MEEKKYIIYNEETQEEYMWGYNYFSAINNLTTFRYAYGNVVKIKWVEASNKKIIK